MRVSSPVAALGAPPDRGASTQASPASAARCARSRVAAGSIDDMSMMSVPAAAPPATPAGPNTAASTIRALLRLRITACACRAASAAEPAATAPCAVRGATRADQRAAVKIDAGTSDVLGAFAERLPGLL